MNQLALIVGLFFATVVAVGVGDRLRLPYPVLMLLLAAALTFIPGFPYLEIPPDSILPIFLPPLLFATAQRSSWSVFRIRWRTIVLLAVALVLISTAFVAGAAWLMIPSIGLPAAIALGAMVAPPDPIAVESVSARVHMPRRLTTVLQSEGLFNDAAAIVIFQAAVGAAVAGTGIHPGVAVSFILGAAIAVVLGILMGWITMLVSRLITSMVARSAVTLVVPFVAYILAEEVHASGVIAVVVTALEIQRHTRPQDAAERITRTAFWDVVELLVTGLAFGLVGLEIRHVVQNEGMAIVPMIGTAVIVCVLVFAVRFGWLALLAVTARRHDGGLMPASAKEVLILTWCGMRGLATLALALALPLTLTDGTAFPARDQLIVIACVVLLATLVLPGLTLPALMRVLNAAEDGSEERDAARLLARRAQAAALAALKDNDFIRELPQEKVVLVREKMRRLHAELLDGTIRNETGEERRTRGRELAITVQTIALDAARQEVVSARNEPGIDPEVADRVLRQLDLRTMIMPE
ncbi:Na+/H+ antiporter [Paenarthrobacter sp. Z7-10]|uniref:Na+/H+ antiporter n=1 Tax=Paenarthrobacter sp. Z7-10 TaxID=2787635 RepID=UPI0022A92030|nr:Na+/H+ antiporter [Paenarthrobacter sp. Z7-10]MCZ2402144.1 Na+/H+ antiporter [Paenarthrobacter sp. Z7-10]